MQIPEIARLMVFIVLAVGSLLVAATSARTETWPATGRILGKNGDKSVDVSDIAA
jgi:hypothetical protein